MNTNYKQNLAWIKNYWVDGIFILSPPFLALLVVCLFPAEFKNSQTMPVAYWVILIVLVDVAHVYSTLFRTYFNPLEFKKQHPLLIAIPLLCYAVGVVLYFMGALVFWRVLAYLAVYHFVRQQYGFMRIYSRKEKQTKSFQYIDGIAIYAATIYPLLYWHLAGVHKNFNWFVNGDFMLTNSQLLLKAGVIVYYLIIIIYLLKEIYLSIKTKQINLPKNILMLGTYLSWYFGIVYFNGDMAFTTLNVISHGIPYMALVWLYERKRQSKLELKKPGIYKLIISRYTGVFLFIIIIVFFAYTEEGLWDGLVWKEHHQVFKPFTILPAINSNMMLALVVPLLSLPQSTHYVLDGFIWRIKGDGNL